jgi:hypothetical protein
MQELPVLVVMAKAPVCGAVKTRLARGIGAVSAVALTRTLTAALLRETAKEPRFRTVLAIAPPQALHARFLAWQANIRGPVIPAKRSASRDRKKPKPAFATIPDNACGVSGMTPRRIAQSRGGLGERMQRIFDACGRGPLIIVGTDIPFIESGMIAEAFRLLRGSDAVFGPAEDGGYWLVGLRCRPKLLRPFAGVRWSSPHALADTLENLSAHRAAFARTLFDIDTEADYRRYRRGTSPEPAANAP